jgi:hypothetical protein
MFGRLTLFEAHFGASAVVECLRCGTARTSVVSATSRLEDAECPACGYLGWCEPGDTHVAAAAGRPSAHHAHPA